MKIIAFTGNEIPGRPISEFLGIVRGLVAVSPGASKVIQAGWSEMGEGSILQFEDVCETARRESHARMMELAKEKGADAVLGVRYESTMLAENIWEFFAYGTAVTLAPAPPVPARVVHPGYRPVGPVLPPVVRKGSQ